MKMGLKQRLAGLLWATWIFILPYSHSAFASDTMLMFVGEDLDVVSIASKRKEAAWSAPAIARVIPRKDMLLSNASTLSRVLEDAAGFYMNQREKGATAYLRGIPDGTLSLFDTVPLGSGVVKSDTFMPEMSMAAVKQVEIVRGSSSVLWGPDAFAGLVNVVPLTGRDFQGVELGLISGNEINPGEAYVNMGHDHGDWNSFLSVSVREKKNHDHWANLVSFWPEGAQEAIPVDKRYGHVEPENDRSVFFYGNWSYKDFLTLSAWVSLDKNAFVLSDWKHKYFWQEQENSLRPGCKIEISHALTPDSSIRFTGYVSGLSQDHSYIDREFTRKEFSYFGEAIYDHSLFFSKALATVGVSFRYDDYEDVLLWDSFFPDFLEEGNINILPKARVMDLSNQLISVFGQYRQKMGKMEFWGGLRSDFHENYEDKISYSLGAVWNLDPFIVKAACGTGYRTPFVRQVQDGDSDRLEKIENLNIQGSWKNQHTKASLCLFHNKVKNHVVEDRYAGAGLSIPNSQVIYGVELEMEHEFCSWFRLAADLTFLNNFGGNEKYLFLDYMIDDQKAEEENSDYIITDHDEDDGGDYIIRDTDGSSSFYMDSRDKKEAKPIKKKKNDGLRQKYYNTLEHEYDLGSRFVGSLRGVIHIGKHVVIEPKVRYFTRQKLFSPFQEGYAVCDPVLLTDVDIHVMGLFFADVCLYAHNVFDCHYESPGERAVARVGRFSAGLSLHMKF